MTICFVSHSSQLGGAEKCLLLLIKGLKEKGYKINVLLPSEGTFSEKLKELEIFYKTIPYKWWMSSQKKIIGVLKRSIWNIFMLIPILIHIKKNKCDLVYTNTCTIAVGAVAAKLLRKPHIWHMREFGYEDHGLIYDLGLTCSLKITKHTTTLCVVNSNAVAEKYCKYIPKQKINLVYESIDFIEKDHPFKLETGNFFICTIVGALHKGKGHKDAILAMDKLLKKGINILLYIVGDGDYKYTEKLKELVFKLNLDKNVLFWGYDNNPIGLMKQSDIILMCSENEAFGLVTIEAMYAGRTIIGTNSGGTKELINDGINGYLYEPGDYKKLCEIIYYLNQNPEKNKEIGQNNQLWANINYKPEKHINEVIDILKKLDLK